MQQGLLGQGLTWGVRVFGIATLTVVNTTAIYHQPSYANGNKFFCTKSNGVPVTMVSTSRGNEPFIRWVFKDFSSSGYTPQKRCEVVSGRLQRYYDNGTLYITSRNNLNGYPVLCIADRQGGSCPNENLLVTLKPGTDTGRVLKQILDFRRGADVKPVELSGSQYVTYYDGDLYLDVKKLVDIDSTVSNQPSRTKNPTTQLEPRF